MASAPDPRKLAAERRAEQARNARFVVEVDGQRHVFRLGDVSAADVGELRRQAGITLAEVTAALTEEIGRLDGTAAMIWLARRHAGELVTYQQVAEGLTLDQVIEVRGEDDPEPVEEFPDPLPSAAAPA